jgi:hypothetical protein
MSRGAQMEVCAVDAITGATILNNCNSVSSSMIDKAHHVELVMYGPMKNFRVRSMK